VKSKFSVQEFEVPGLCFRTSVFLVESLADQPPLSESVYTGVSKLPWKPEHFICSEVWAFHGSDCNWNCFLW